MFIRSRPNQLPFVVLISLSAVWGAGFYLTQIGLQSAGAFGFVAMRCAAAASVLALLSWKGLRRVTRHEILGGSIIASLAVIGFGTCAMALETESSARVAFLSSLYVLLVPMMQFIFFKERPPAKLISGGLIAFFGIGILSGSFASGRVTLSSGDILSIISAVSISIEIMLLSFFMRKANATRLAVLVMAITAFFGAFIGVMRGENLPIISYELVLVVFVFGAATAYIQFAMGWAQKKVSASNAAIIYSLEPIFASLIGLAIGEALGVHELVGGALMVTGAIIASARFKKSRNRQRMVSV